MDDTEKIRERIAKAVEIAGTDPDGKKLARKLADGKLLVKVGDEIEIPILVRDGTLTVTDDPTHPKAVCRFSDSRAAWAILTKAVSPYAATVHRQLMQEGLSPMNETFEKILFLTHERLCAGK